MAFSNISANGEYTHIMKIHFSNYFLFHHK